MCRLRLRQLCGHVLLVETLMRDILQEDDIKKLKDISKSVADPANDDDRKMQMMQLRAALNALDGEQTTASPDSVNQTGGTGASVSNPEPATNGHDADAQDNPLGGDHGQSYKFHMYLMEMERRKKWEALKESMTCVRCHERTASGMVTNCIHLYCANCYMHVEEGIRMQEGGQWLKCDECEEDIHTHKSFEEYDKMMGTNESLDPNREKTRRRKKKKPNPNDIDASGEKSVKDWIDLYPQVLPSAKTIAVKAQIINWVQKNPDVKIIIYTQFLSMIRILAKICVTERWGFCEFHGRLNVDARMKSIETFEKSPDARLLLASLKCGGIGLNLTMASKVICIDPWWNHAAEQQAFCRVFRRGQTLETTMTRFVVKGTIDEELMEMQAKKLVDVNQVMENANNEKRRLVSPHPHQTARRSVLVTMS